MLALALTLVLAAPPKHPWTSFKPGAWAQYVSGTAEARRGAVTFTGLEGTHVTIRGSGELRDEASWQELGMGCPACVNPNAVGKRTISVMGKSLSCEVFEFQLEGDVYRQCHAPGHELPLQIEEEVGAQSRVVTLTATDLAVPIFVGGQKLMAVRYETSPSAAYSIVEVRSTAVPGGLVMQIIDNPKTGGHGLRVLEAFGTSGSPVGNEVTRSAWHPWASHPLGSWSKVAMKAGKRIDLKLSAVTDTTVTFESAPQTHHARGEVQAASDPASKLGSLSVVLIAGIKYPCVSWIFEGEEQNRGKFTRRDCVSPFARVPLYSTESWSRVGLTFSEAWIAETVEVAGKLGKHSIGAVTFSRTLQISNGNQSFSKVVKSADVPGGIVTWTNLEGAGLKKPELWQQAVDFGR